MQRTDKFRSRTRIDVLEIQRCRMAVDSTDDLNFGANPDWETGFYTNSNQIHCGDIDGDGDYDMLIASELPTFQLALCENRNGSLSRPPPLVPQ